MQSDLELRPTSGGRFAAGLLAVLFLGMAVMLFSLNKAHAAAPIGIGLALFALGIALFALTVQIGRRRVILNAEGIEVRGIFGAKQLAWNAVSSYSFFSIDTQHAAYYSQGGLAAVLIVAIVKALRKKSENRKFKGGRLVLHGNAGQKLMVRSWFRDMDQGLERIFAEVHPRLARTVGTRFGKLTFDGQNLTHDSKGSLSLLEIEKIVVSSQGSVSIRKVGKRLAWARMSMARIPCALLLFERFAQAGVFVDTSQEVFLPLPTLGVLSRLATARQNLPQARVQQR